jgi:hypothetical protein
MLFVKMVRDLDLQHAGIDALVVDAVHLADARREAYK